MGNIGQPGGQQSDLMSQFAPLVQALRPDINMYQVYDPATNGLKWTAVNNPNYNGNKNQDPNAEVTKTVMQTLGQIASTAISNQNKPDAATSTLNSILPTIINRTLNQTDQVAAIQKMIEVANTLQKPQVQETPEIAMAKTDTKMDMWREDLEWRRTVHDWDVQDKRERQAKEQQESFLNLFKEAGKDVVPAFLKMFGPMVMGAMMPKGATPEQMAAQAMRQQYGPQGPGMVIPPPNMRRGPPVMEPPEMPPSQQQFNPFQHQQFNPFQGQMPMQQQPPMQQPPMQQQAPAYYQQPPQEEDHIPGPEEFTGLGPEGIDRILEVTQDRQAKLEQYANNARIAKAQLR